MKCTYVNDPQLGKVLIPGCWSAAVSRDIDDCICQTKSERIKQIESEMRKLESELTFLKQWNKNP